MKQSALQASSESRNITYLYRIPGRSHRGYLRHPPAPAAAPGNAPQPAAPRRQAPRPRPTTSMLRRNEAAVSCSNCRCRARPINPPSLRSEIILREPDQGRDQFRQPVAAAGRNLQIRRAPPRRSADRPTRPLVEIDLVAHQPDRRSALAAESSPAAHRPATAPGRHRPPAPAPDARPPAPPDRRSRECPAVSITVTG